MINEQFVWCEKYRPKTISDCIIPESLKETFLGILKQGDIPNLLLNGSPGTGKTTVCKALCEELGVDYIVINGSLGADESGIEAFRGRVRQFASSVSLMGGRKIVIVDEADYLNPNSSQPALRGLMEEFSKNCGFLFTSNYKNRLLEPIRSRFALIEFAFSKKDKKQLVGDFSKRIFQILKSENVEFDKKVIVDLVMNYYPDFRRVINELQRFAFINGKIDIGILGKQSGEVNLSILISALKDKDFYKTREWVVNNINNDTNLIYRKVYESLLETAKPDTLPESIVLLGNYQYKSAFVADQEVNLLAFLTELMVTCEFK